MKKKERLFSICIEGIPLIIRFKTSFFITTILNTIPSIEGIPVIIRFKTQTI